MVEAVVVSADLTMARVGAECGLRVLLTTTVGVVVSVDVGNTHSVGVLRLRARIAQRGILLDDNRRQTISSLRLSQGLVW
jgi:hypothetical protein